MLGQWGARTDRREQKNATTQHHKAERKKLFIKQWLMALTPAFVSLKILSKNTSFSFHAFTVDHLGGPLVYCLLFGPDRQPQAKQAPDDPCTSSPMFERNGQILYTMAYGPAPLLTYYAKLMKIGPTHTHIPDTDPLSTTPPSQQQKSLLGTKSNS
jgi:hypothetical protein